MSSDIEVKKASGAKGKRNSIANYEWGSSAAKTYNFTPQDLMHSIYGITNKDSQKKCLFRLSTVLCDPEIAEAFDELEGLPHLITALQSTSGNSLSYTLKALSAFASNDFAADELRRDPTCTNNVYILAKRLAFSSTNIQVQQLKASLQLLTQLSSHGHQGLSFLDPSQGSDHSADLFHMIQVCLAPKLTLDVQLNALRFVNALIQSSKTKEEYLFVTEGLSMRPGIQESFDRLASIQPLAKELQQYRTMSSKGFGHADINAFLRKEIRELSASVHDLQSLANEYRSENQTLRRKLMDYERREPLVQLLWDEVQHLRGSLRQALALGYSYDLCDPTSRYSPAHASADIDDLDVLTYKQHINNPASASSSTHARMGRLLGGGMDRSLGMRMGMGIGGPLGRGMNRSGRLDSASVFPVESYSSPVIRAPSRAAPKLPGPPALPASLPSHTTSSIPPSSSPPPPPMPQSAPPPPPTTSAATSDRSTNNGTDTKTDAEPVANKASSSSPSTGTSSPPPAPSKPAPKLPSKAAPTAPSVPGAPPIAPGVPGAPPMVPGIPGAPPMAPGIPGAPPAPGIPGAPSAPGIPGAPPAPGAPVAPSGPTFNQPIIKPKNKMKVLHWHRILINKQTFDSTSHIWAEAWKNEDGDLKEQIKIDEEDFAYMFSATKAKSKKKANVDAGADADSGTEGQAATGDGKKTAGKKGKTVRLLVAKRFNAVCIGLRALPEPPVIFKAIRNLSTSRLSKEQLQTLQRISPTEAEIRAINASRASDDELGVAEKFIRDLSKIPMVSARIECWHFKVNFKEMIEQNSLPLLLIRKAVDAVVDSKALKQFLYVVLHCGNYMNGGTSRGQADAFDLGILTRIKGIRDTPGGSISLQQYICNVCVQSFGRDFGTRLENELSEALRAGSGNSMVFAGSQIASAAATVKRMKNLSLLVKSASDSAQDPFVTQMLAFNTVAADQIKQMKTRFEKTTKKVNDFFIYMNPNLSPNQLGQMKCEDVFHIMYNVVQDVSAGVTIYNDMHP